MNSIMAYGICKDPLHRGQLVYLDSNGYFCAYKTKEEKMNKLEWQLLQLPSIEALHPGNLTHTYHLWLPEKCEIRKAVLLPKRRVGLILSSKNSTNLCATEILCKFEVPEVKKSEDIMDLKEFTYIDTITLANHLCHIFLQQKESYPFNKLKVPEPLESVDFEKIEGSLRKEIQWLAEKLMGKLEQFKELDKLK